LPTRRWQRLGVDLVAAGIGTVAAFVAFLVAGLAVFPGRNWIGTYLEWNSRLDYTVFIGDDTTWQRDSALIVVVVALLASCVATIAQPRHRWAWAALALSTANIGLTIVLMLVLPGPWLESPTYVAKLWPAALLSLVLVFTSMSPGTHEGKQLFQWPLGIVAALTVPFLLWSGRFDGVLPYTVAWTIGMVVVTGIIAVALLVRRHWSVWISTALAASIALTFVGMQFLQNGRGLLGTYGQYPFRSAFVDFSYDKQMAAKIAIEKWLISHTSRDDSIAIWTDVERLTADVAAMQMWGGDNLVTLDATLSREDVETLEAIRPSVIAMYAPERSQIDAFFASLPPWSLPSEPTCTSEPYLGVGTGEVIACLTRLTWVG
jgi:hypothetical protein